MRIIDIYVFLTAILITYIKGGTPAQNFFCRQGLQWRGLHLLIFFTEVIKFYWLMLLLYPGELYRFLGASSFLPRCLKCSLPLAYRIFDLLLVVMFFHYVIYCCQYHKLLHYHKENKLVNCNDWPFLCFNCFTNTLAYYWKNYHFCKVQNWS